MNYSWVAPIYRGIEWLSFGGCLQKARVSMLEHVEWSQMPAPRVLVVGGGDGRVLPALLERLPSTGVVDFVEPSSGMVAVAKKCAPVDARIQWRECLLEEWLVHELSYDVVVLQFFIDSFHYDDGSRLLAEIDAKCLARGSVVLVADFDPNVGWWAQLWTWVMQGFFLVSAGVKPVRFLKVNAAMTKLGMQLLAEDRQMRGFIYSNIWKKM